MFRLKVKALLCNIDSLVMGSIFWTIKYCWAEYKIHLLNSSTLEYLIWILPSFIFLSSFLHFTFERKRSQHWTIDEVWFFFPLWRQFFLCKLEIPWEHLVQQMRISGPFAIKGEEANLIELLLHHHLHPFGLCWQTWSLLPMICLTNKYFLYITGKNGHSS